jgi:hypothetical protein
MILRLEPITTFAFKAVGIRCADHVTSSARKSRHHFADSGGRSVGIFRLRTKATEFSLDGPLNQINTYTRDTVKHLRLYKNLPINPIQFQISRYRNSTKRIWRLYRLHHVACVEYTSLTVGTTNRGSYSSEEKLILICTSLIYYMHKLMLYVSTYAYVIIKDPIRIINQDVRKIGYLSTDPHGMILLSNILIE